MVTVASKADMEEKREEKVTTAVEMRKVMADNKVDMKEDKAGDTADNKVVVMAAKKEEKATTGDKVDKVDKVEHSAVETSTKSVVKEVERPKAIMGAEENKADKKKRVTVAAMRDMEDLEITHTEVVEDMVPMTTT